MRHVSRLSWFLALGLMLATGAVRGQVTPAANSRLPDGMHLGAVVTGSKDRPVQDLGPGDFHVSINGQQEPVVQVVRASAESEPVVMLLLDDVNTPYRGVMRARDEIKRYLVREGTSLKHPTSLLVLTDTRFQTTAPTTDGKALLQDLAKAQIGLREFNRGAGFYGWAEQFDISARAIEQLAAVAEKRPRRKILIWVSPGWPLLSGPEVQLSKAQQARLFRTVAGLTTSLQRAQITLSTVDPLGTEDAISYNTTFYQQFVKGARDAGQMQFGYLGLQTLAVQSGGRVLTGSNDTTAEIAAAASDADAVYDLTVREPPAERPDEYCRVAVTVDRAGAAVRSRQIFYANAAAGSPADPKARTVVPAGAGPR